MEANTMSAWLENAEGARVVVAGTCSLGRGPGNEIVLPFGNVSRRHAIIHRQGDNEYWLVDLGSSNGTSLNGRRVNQPVQLRDRDLLEIGPSRFQFRQPSAAGADSITLSGQDKTVREIKTAECWLLVADIENSTALARQVEPDKLPMLTGHWFSSCKRIIDENGGAINKFLGDGFFAYWLDGPGREAEFARAIAGLTRLQDESQLEFRFVFHHSKVLMGGVAAFGEESLAGEGVNLVFRLEKLAGGLGHRRLASEAAKRRLGNGLPMTEAGAHSLPGFQEPHSVFTF